MKKIRTVLLVAVILLVGASLGQGSFAKDNVLRSDTNPLAGNKIIMEFIGEEENIVIGEPLVYNQIVYIVNRHGEKLKEYAVRQHVRIIVPELEEEEGWIFNYWTSYYKGRAFYLEPIYRIKLNITDAHGQPLAVLTCDIGHTVSVVGKYGENISREEYCEPSTVVLPEPPFYNNYVFDKWSSENNRTEYVLKAMYNPIIYFADEDGKKLFNVTLRNGEKFYITDIDGNMVEETTVYESDVVTLVPPKAPLMTVIVDKVEKEIEMQLYGWESHIDNGRIYIKPVFGKPLAEGKALPMMNHAETVRLGVTRAPATTAVSEAIIDEVSAEDPSNVVIDNEANTIIINGVTLPLAIVTWGIPVVLVGVSFLLFFLRKKRKKQEAQKNGNKNEAAESPVTNENRPGDTREP